MAYNENTKTDQRIFLSKQTEDGVCFSKPTERVLGMKKGDLRRKAVVEAAQQLFWDKGYENTSVQDILDQMGMSKGGFYHYFESKQQLLEEICRQQAETACIRGIQAAEAVDSGAIAKLNALFREGGFFGEESIKSTVLMLRAAYGGQMDSLRQRTRRITLEMFEPVLRRILLEGMEQELFYMAYPDSAARLLILLAMDVTDEVAFLMAENRAGQPDLGQMMELLGAYREAAELMLNAPHGSLELLDMVRIAQVLKALGLLTGPGA